MLFSSIIHQAKMAKPSAVDYALIQCLLQEDHEKQEKQPHASPFISILVAWIAGSAPPSSPADYRQDLQARGCMEKLCQTTPPSFAIAFLEYLRTESETVSEAQSDSESGKTEQASSIQNALNTTSSAPPEEANKTKDSASRTAPIKTPAKPKENSYDAEFPVLGVSNTHVSQKSIQLQIRPKRRVNPTPMENPVVDSAFVLAKVESRNPSKNSIPRTRSSAPLKIDMDVLMQRCDDKRKLKPRTVETANCSLNQLRVTGQNQCISQEDGVAFTGSTKNVLRSSVVPNSTVLKLKRFATVHSKLISERMVPSLIGELQHLFQLLSLGQSSKQQCGKDSSEKKLFGCGDDCSLYACIVMEQLGRVLDFVGEPLLLALINHPVIAQLSPALLMRMKESLVSHQATALHSFKSYKISNAQNAHSQSADIGMPVSLPFQAARDSRNHYKSRESQKLYNNRELSRDYFYAIIRDAASALNSFGYTIDHSRLKTQESVKSLINNLLIENYPWFTELFLEQFVQVAMCGETDPVVTGLARQDPMKLQRLHDRLTLGHRNKAANSLVPLSLGHKANNIGDPKGSVKVLKSSSQILSDVKPEKANLAGMELTSFFPPSLRVYVWIMEAADSYRLSMQMIWSLKSKICKLTEIPQHSRDAAEIGSLLTQRVLSLKALSGLLGFLCFFPGAGSSSQGFEEWEIRRTEPPIDVVETLEKAIISETMLLTLPWVLDFLRFIKADQYAVSLPYFQKALLALRNVYNYSILDPKSDSFGVPSICILASLDRFFEFMDLPAWDINVHHSVIEPGKIHRFAEDNGCMLDTKTSCGLDRIIGVVDASYIQQCCPTLMELRLLLTESERQSKNSNSASKSNVVHVKALRKITPVHHPKNSQIFDRASSCGLENVPTSLDNFIQVKLQQSFFEQRQELQRLVDFVVDTTAVNAARAASLRCVPPILEGALRKLQVALAHKFQGSMDKEGESQQESQVEAVVENIITSSIQEALSPAMEYAKNHTAERTSEALAVLASPDESPFALGIAARIAADAAGSAACKKTLANISCDIRKHITQEVESWRQSSQNILKYDARGKQLQEKAFSACGASRAFNVTTQLHIIFGGGKENIKSSCDFSQEKKTVLKQSTFYENDTDSVEKNHTFSEVTGELSETISGSTGVLVQPPCSWENESCSLLDRALHCCAGVVECCADFVLIDNQRHLLRVKLAAVCTSIETMLSLECGQLPLGGFDAIVHANINSKDPSLSFELGKVTDVATSYTKEAGAEARFIIERGLARRCVALALYLCLQSPLEAFGYNPEALGQCMCLSISNSQYVNKLVVTAELKGALCKLLKDDKSREPEIFIEKCVEPTGDSQSEKSSEGTSECRRNNRLGGLMLGLLSMWEALVKCEICQVNFFLSEFLSSWRWIQAIQPEPWKTSKFWFEALNHGIANVLLKLIYMAHASNNVEKPVYTLLESFFTDFFQKKHNVSRKLVALDELNTKMENLRRLVACILLEVIYLQAWQGHTPDKYEIDRNHCHQDSITRGLISVISLVEACCMNMEV